MYYFYLFRILGHINVRQATTVRPAHDSAYGQRLGQIRDEITGRAEGNRRRPRAERRASERCGEESVASERAKQSEPGGFGADARCGGAGRRALGGGGRRAQRPGVELSGQLTGDQHAGRRTQSTGTVVHELHILSTCQVFIHIHTGENDKALVQSDFN